MLILNLFLLGPKLRLQGFHLFSQSRRSILTVRHDPLILLLQVINLLLQPSGAFLHLLQLSLPILHITLQANNLTISLLNSLLQHTNISFQTLQFLLKCLLIGTSLPLQALLLGQLISQLLLKGRQLTFIISSQLIHLSILLSRNLRCLLSQTTGPLLFQHLHSTVMDLVDLGNFLLMGFLGFGGLMFEIVDDFVEFFGSVVE
mmetsp:Transcript_52792/g.60449  ORF Transcript_52792/g.60449 Transcript_52792/m.60449 type:complete len:203 (-) Transcript_52792:1366-1974(-)